MSTARRVVAALGLAAAAWLAPGLSPPALAGSGSEALDAYLREVRSFRARFEQTVHDEAMRPVERSRGRVALLRPGRFRWVYEGPDGQEIVGDGKNVWVYDPSLDQVTVTPLASALGNSPAALLTTDRPVEEHYAVRELAPTGELAWVELRPKADDPGFEVVRLAFRGPQLAAMELVDAFRNVTQIRFLEVEVNPALDPGDFRFTPPPGADVLRNGPVEQPAPLAPEAPERGR